MLKKKWLEKIKCLEGLVLRNVALIKRVREKRVSGRSFDHLLFYIFEIIVRVRARF